MIRLLSFIIIILLPNLSFAQQGWVRVADGPWAKADKVYFISEDTGFVEDIPSWPNRLIHVTVDGGKTWKLGGQFGRHTQPCQRSSELRITEAHPVTRTAVNSNVIFGGYEYHSECGVWSGESGNVWKYDLSRSIWTSFGTSLGILDKIEVVNDSVIHVVSSQRGNHDQGTPSLIRSTDSGNSWEHMGVPLKRPLMGYASLFQSKDTGLVWGYNIDHEAGQYYSDRYRTINGCKSWIRLEDTLKDGAVLLNPPFYGNNGRWYSHTTNGLYSSFDIGLTWQVSTEPPILLRSRPDDAFFSFDEGYRCLSVDSTTFIIQYTSDSTKTWVGQDTVEIRIREISAPSERVAYAVGDNGVLYKTTDGGGRFASSVDQTSGEVISLTARWSNPRIEVRGLIVAEPVYIYDVLGRQKGYIVPNSSSMILEVPGCSREVLIISQHGRSVRLWTD